MKRIIIQENQPLASYTTFNIGGNAQYFCSPSTLEELREGLIFANNKNLQINIIGGGSNLLISDNGVKGLTIHTGELEHYKINDTTVVAECGIPNKDLEKILIEHSLQGLEFSGGLPGSIGGAVYMNARCYGGEFSKVVDKIEVVDIRGNIFTINSDEADFSYKQSIFMKKKEWIIYRVHFTLKKGDREKIKKEYETHYLDRKNKGQFDYPSAGCAFKNNYTIGIPSGNIISDLDLKGLTIGKASVANFHGNFIINKGDASAQDVKSLIETIQQKVKEQKDISLEREIEFIGFD